MMDYYYLLMTTDNGQGATDNGQGGDVQEMIELLGLRHFASATMWVLHKVFGLEERYYITGANQDLGEFLLREIMMSGNFGQYDERVKHDASPWQKNIQRLKRDLRLLCYFPSECLWEPIFRWYHFFWRMRNR
jgi:hypothetical protein